MLFVLGVFFGVFKAYSSTVAVIYVDPVVSMASPGEYFTINLNVANVTGLWLWECKMSFNPECLYINSTMIKEGPFLSDVGSTTFAIYIGPYYIMIGCSFTGPDTVDGSGTLAHITFKVLKEGASNFHLYDSNLQDPDFNPIDHTTKDGYFSTPTEEIDVINEVEVLGNNYTIIITTNSSLSPVPFQYDTIMAKIWFNATGPAGMTGFCNVSIPKNFMWCDTMDDWQINVNGEPTTYQAVEDAERIYLYFTYPTSINTVEITSQYMVPEFQPTLLMLILIIATLTPVFLRKKLH